MKKFLVMLAIMAIAVSGAFAVEGTGAWVGTGTESPVNKNATMEVTLDLSSGSVLGKYYMIGFTSSVASLSSTNLEVEPLKTVALNTATTTGDFTTQGDVYVYWAIKDSSTKYDIQLSLDNDLTTSSEEEGDKFVKWSVTPTSEGSKLISDGTGRVSQNKSTVVGNSIGGAADMQVGSNKITISTEDLLNSSYAEGEYTGTLTVTIIADGE